MNSYFKYLPVVAIVSLLFLKDVVLVISASDNPLYWMENTEETEQKSDNKEKEEKKESDDKKITAAAFSLLSNHLTCFSLHIVSERSYCSPSFDVVSPPPKRA